MASEYLEIKIVNWEKYQAEAKRYKNPGWFRLDEAIMRHALWDILTPIQFKLFILLLALTCKDGHTNGQIVTTQRTLGSLLSGKRRIRQGHIEGGLVSLRDLGIVDFQIVKMGSPTDFRRLRNGTERNGTEQGSATDLKLVGDGKSEPQPEKKKLTDLKESVFKDIRRIQGKVGEQEDEV